MRRSDRYHSLRFDLTRSLPSIPLPTEKTDPVGFSVMPKTLVRTELLQHRIALGADDSHRLSAQIQGRLLLLPEYAAAQTIALYHPVKREVETAMIFAAGRSCGKTLCFPRTCGDHLEFVAVDRLADLAPGRYGIFEPVGGRAVAVAEFDLVVLPGIGFDRRGFRLGYGKGYYDRTLAGRTPRTRLVGLGYRFQIVESLPTHDHDIALDMVVTEDEIYRHATCGID